VGFPLLFNGTPRAVPDRVRDTLTDTATASREGASASRGAGGGVSRAPPKLNDSRQAGGFRGDL
jgi:hypothetical protein